MIADLLGYRVGHIPFLVPTTVPTTLRAWFRQRFAWAGGEFRLFIVNWKLVRHHPFMWTYGVAVMFATLPLRWWSALTAPPRAGRRVGRLSRAHRVDKLAAPRPVALAHARLHRVQQPGDADPRVALVPVDGDKVEECRSHPEPARRTRSSAAVAGCSSTGDDPATAGHKVLRDTGSEASQRDRRRLRAVG